VSNARDFGWRNVVLPMLVTIAALFAAARLLPPIDSQALSLAVVAGYTNRLYALLLILLAGGLAMGALGRRRGMALALRIGTSGGPARLWRWHVAAACALCVAHVSLFQTWSDEAGYFGVRLALMDEHKVPYWDFEFAYGFANIYVPYALHLLGLSIRAALVLAIDIAVVCGVLSIGVMVAVWIADVRLRLVLFWSLVLCDAFVDPGPSLTYNFERYAAPFAVLLLLTKHGPGWKPPVMFAASAGASLLAFSLSPEMGLAFAAASLAWLMVAFRALSRSQLVAVALAIVAVTGGLILFAAPIFTTLLAFSSVRVVLPVIPHAIMLLVIASFLVLCAGSMPAVVSVWREPPDSERTLIVARACACAALAAALVPAVIGRTWPSTTLAYGFGSVVIAVGYLIAAGAIRAAAMFGALFALCVAYSAASVVRGDIAQLRRCGLWEPACAQADVGSPRAIRQAAWRRLAPRFPNAYDPLDFIGHGAPHTVDVGYYPGLGQGNALDAVGIARKTAELQRAGYYILPERRVGERPYTREAGERTLDAFRRRSGFPFALPAVRNVRSVQREFVDMLYDRCKPVAEEGGVTVCARINDRGRS
jgi:hypothetical protein